MKARRGGQGASPRSPRYRIFHKTLGLEQGARELIVAAHSVGFARPRKRQHRVAPRKPSNSLALVHPLHAYTRLPPRVCARSASLCVRVFTRVQLPPFLERGGLYRCIYTYISGCMLAAYTERRIGDNGAWSQCARNGRCTGCFVGCCCVIFQAANWPERWWNNIWKDGVVFFFWIGEKKPYLAYLRNC